MSRFSHVPWYWLVIRWAWRVQFNLLRLFEIRLPEPAWLQWKFIEVFHDRNVAEDRRHLEREEIVWKEMNRISRGEASRLLGGEP